MALAGWSESCAGVVTTTVITQHSDSNGAMGLKDVIGTLKGKRANGRANSSVNVFGGI